MIFNPHGLLIPFENRSLFISVIFVVSMAIGFGAWLVSGYPLKMFTEAALIVTLWIFLFVLPISMLPLSGENLGLIMSFSLLLLVVAYGEYSRRRKKRQSL
jgi:hypothetical protein